MAAAAAAPDEAELMSSVAQGGQYGEFGRAMYLGWPILPIYSTRPNPITAVSWYLEALMIAFSQAGDHVGLSDVPLGATSIRSITDNKPEDAAGAAALVVFDNIRHAPIPFTLHV